jgi:hypothetical protein
MFASTATRVAANTPEHINECIRQRTENNIARYTNAGRAAIDSRLLELEQEWDIERYVETLAPSLTLAGLGLGVTVSKKWLLIPFLVQGFFLQHAIQGWCPPVPILRRFGVRTTEEINYEKNALKAIRGDYREIPAVSHNGGLAHQAFQAASR